MDSLALENKSENNPEKTKSSVEELLGYKGKKFFHGSLNSSLDKLEPRQASEVDSAKTFNNDKAVYATKNPTEAIIYAVVDPFFAADFFNKSYVWSVHNYGDRVLACIPKDWEPIVKKGSGTVYVLPVEKFTEITEDHGKCKEEIIPDDKIDVTFADYLLLGGEVEWK